jgi:hypothetical protein
MQDLQPGELRCLSIQKEGRMITAEQAARLVLASAIRDAIADQVEEVRAELRPSLNPGDRTSALVDGVNLGSVQMTAPKATLRVVDYADLMVWAMAHAPDAIVTTTTVNQAWVASLLKSGGEWADPATGEVLEVPGLGTSEPSPQLRVTRTDAASAWALAALTTAMGTAPALTTGEPQ